MLDGRLGGILKRPIKLKPKKSKYKNKPVIIDGIKFASIKEGQHYRKLKRLLEAGKISDLKLQPKFNIAASVMLDGKKKAIRKYTADFSYNDENGEYVVVDVKGFKTEMYKFKRHLVKELHNIEVVEV